MSTQLVWFRNDLRVSDNPALYNALANGPTVAIYIATPAQWQQHDDAPIKLDFWRRNLKTLASDLSRLDVELLFFQVEDYKAVPALLNRLIDDLNIKRLHYNREYPLNELIRDKRVDDLCQQRDVTLSGYNSDVLVPPSSILNQSGQPFRVFTPFSRALRDELHLQKVGATVSLQPSANSQQPASDRVNYNCSIEEIDWPQTTADTSERWRSLWPAGEQEAHSRLENFVKNKISVYKEKRDLPADAHTSTLSPYLNSGVISIADCWRLSQRFHDDDGVRCWQNELLWREFYRHIVFHFPHVCMHKPFKDNVDHVPWQHNQQEFKNWCHGNTGFPLVDAGMRQLKSCGWMHNRLRMVTAMFLSKHLLIDWRWGERWFMQNLIDGDFASNNGGWQWCASTGVDAAPYFRIFSPTRQSQRFDADGEYIRQYVPELRDLPSSQIHEPGNDRPEQYPLPLVDHKLARERALQAFAAT